MTLDEAILHAEESAQKHQGTECGDEHLELAGWLKELRTIRQKGGLKKVHNALALLNSMVAGGEAHSERSRQEVREAFDILAS